MSIEEQAIIVEMHKLFEEGERVELIASELEVPVKEVVEVYEAWKQGKMDKLAEGDKVCYVLNIKGYKKHLVYGNICAKKTNAVIVESKGNDYIEDALKGKVVVSVKDILKVR